MTQPFQSSQPSPGDPKEVIDAEFVDVKAGPAKEPSAPPPPGFGRRVVAEDTGKPPPALMEVAANVLGAVEPVSRAAASVARAFGKDGAAKVIENHGELAGHAAHVASQIPEAAKAIDEGTKPLRNAWAQLKQAVKDRGLVTRRPPRTVQHAPKTRHGKEMDGDGPK